MSENKFKEITDELADLLERKNKAYGDAFNQTEKIMRVLYPNGIEVSKYGDMLAIVRILDKLFRISTFGTGNDLMNEDAWKDIAGYSILKLLQSEKEDLD